LIWKNKLITYYYYIIIIINYAISYLSYNFSGFIIMDRQAYLVYFNSAIALDDFPEEFYRITQNYSLPCSCS